MYLMSLNCKLKMVKTVNFMGCVFYHNYIFFKKKHALQFYDTPLIKEVESM